MLRNVLMFGLICVVACDGGDSESGDTDSDASGSTTAGSTSSPGPDDDDGPSSMTGSDSATTSATSGTSATTTTATNGTTSATSTTDDPETTSTTSGSSSGGESDSSSNEGGGSIDVTLDGCDIDFGGTVVVSFNGSLGVASVYDDGATLTGSFQFDLDGEGTMMLSTQHRVDTGNVINMVDNLGTWTNIDGDSFGNEVDRISGTLVVENWNPSQGQASFTFQDVSLLHVSNGNVCTINGTIVAEELYP